MKPSRRCLTGACVLTAASLSSPASGQTVRQVVLHATVAEIGKVLSISPLERRDVTPSGRLVLTGYVRTTHNGPYALQARLATAPTDTVMVRTPNGSFRVLDSTAWITVATGPGGKNLDNAVELRIRGTDATGRSPQQALSMPVDYRVIAP